MKYNKQQSLEIENYLDRHNCVRCHSSANLTIDHIPQKSESSDD